MGEAGSAAAGSVGEAAGSAEAGSVGEAGSAAGGSAGGSEERRSPRSILRKVIFQNY